MNHVGSSYIATFQTNTLSVGLHTITATYSGDGNYIGSSGTMTQTIVGPPAAIAAVSGGGQTTTYGTAFASPLVARVTDSAGNPVPGATVTFSGSGSLSFSPAYCEHQFVGASIGQRIVCKRRFVHGFLGERRGHSCHFFADGEQSGFDRDRTQYFAALRCGKPGVHLHDYGLRKRGDSVCGVRGAQPHDDGHDGITSWDLHDYRGAGNSRGGQL